MSAPFPSPPTLVVLHAVRISGRLPTDKLPTRTGLTRGTVDDELRAGVEAGTLCHHDGVIIGWSLTPAGRERHAELLADEGAAAGRAAAIAVGYDDLLRLNEGFKGLCTEWQLEDQPASCVDRLTVTHRRVDAITRGLAAELTRFEPYGGRFTHALDRLRGGDLDAFTTPLTDSYHDVWMELHEDLLLTLDRERTTADGS